MTEIVIKFAPIGIFGLVVPVVGDYGIEIILPLLKVIFTMIIACFIHLIFYSFAVKTFGRMSPIKFFTGIFPAGTVAFSTCSSAGTLPVTFKNTLVYRVQA